MTHYKCLHSRLGRLAIANVLRRLCYNTNHTPSCTKITLTPQIRYLDIVREYYGIDEVFAYKILCTEYRLLYGIRHHPLLAKQKQQKKKKKICPDKDISDITG